jgi:hypothetical protein
MNTWYQVKPLRTLSVGGTTYQIDTPWSKPFQSSTPLYDVFFTRLLLPTLRFTYLGDQGTGQTNGTNLEETTGSGMGQWVFDGTTTRFLLQYVMNDDPVRVLDDIYTMTYSAGGPGNNVIMTPYVDYIVDTRNGVVEFAVPPNPGDYMRFDFRRTDFVNSDLLIGLMSAINSASSYGLNGYQINQSANLNSINKPIALPDLAEIFCKIAIIRMREGQTEQAMRSTAAWRDGSSSVDPFPSRALDFLIQKTDLNETHIRREINTYLRSNVLPKARGEFDIFWDLTQLTPLTSGMFGNMPGGSYGTLGAGLGQPFSPWYI